MQVSTERETIYSKNGLIWEDVTHEGDYYLFLNIGNISVMHHDKSTEEIETVEDLLEAIENKRKIVMEK